MAMTSAASVADRPERDVNRFAEPAYSNDPAHAADNRRTSVLIVDDTEDNRIILTLMLEIIGYDVESASSAGSALQALRDRTFDAVLMDVSMPGCDGLMATSMIRDMGGVHRELPIVAVTASVSAKVKAECFAAGMQDYLAKPVTINQLQTTIERLLN